jgi:DNA-binding CsgD family transcriptional regulator
MPVFRSAAEQGTDSRLNEAPVERKDFVSSSPWQKSISSVPSEAVTLGVESKRFLCEPPPEMDFCHRSLGHAVFHSSDWVLLRNTLGLSTREFQIAQCVFDDEKQETIAWRLGISLGTVNTYMQRLYTKLGVRSRPQLIVRVIAAYLTCPSISTRR